MTVKQQDIQSAIRSLNLSKQVVCLHSSLRSFGHVEGGAITVANAFLNERCTLLVPTFSSAFEVGPPPHLQFERNGWAYTGNHMADHGSDRIYATDTPDIDRDMGAIPATIVTMSDRVRGDHPLDSFTAIGPRAAEIVSGQAPSDVYAPLISLIRLQGFVLLMGVGLEKMTLLHLAEKEAGRTLFRRWAKGPNGETIAVEVGGCSEGFGKLEPYLRPNMQTITVGESMWRLYPADRAMNCAAEAIRANPLITHCGLTTCERCNDAVAGGPILNTDTRSSNSPNTTVIGLEEGKLKLYQYNPVWKQLFLEEKNLLQPCIGRYVVDIQHIGSTSIPGIVAKPILDIGIAVNDFEEAKICIEPIVKLGYEYRGEYGIPRRHYFVKGNPRTHHLHMVELHSKDWEINIKFRDYLIQNPEVAREYSELKQRLALQYATNRKAYQDEKGLFINKVINFLKDEDGT